MGRAIVRDPKAFLMDEPLSNLDAKLRVQMRTEVSRLQADLGTTTVYVTHDQTEAMTLGDRVAVMRSGVLQQVGTPAELYDSPANLFVAGFIGSPAMNFMPATIEGGTVKLPFGEVDAAGAPARGDRAAGRGDRRASGRRASRTRRSSATPRTAARRSRRRSTWSSRWARRSTPTSSIEGEGVESEELAELAQDAGAERGARRAARQIVARLDAASKVERGDEAELWVDTSKLHLFDADSGDDLAGAEPRAAPAPSELGGAGVLARATRGAAELLAQALEHLSSQSWVRSSSSAG